MEVIVKKGQVLLGTVERVDFPNKGIVDTPEGQCVVKNVLPGQKISFVVQKKEKRAGRGPSFNGGRKISFGDRECLCPFWGVRRMRLSVTSL